MLTPRPSLHAFSEPRAGRTLELVRSKPLGEVTNHHEVASIPLISTFCTDERPPFCQKRQRTTVSFAFVVPLLSGIPSKVQILKSLGAAFELGRHE